MAGPAEGWELAAQIATVAGGGATVLTAAIAFGALLFARSQVAHQAGARDFQAFIELQRDVGTAWEKYKFSSDDTRQFYFGQLIAVYESACYMFNHGIVGEKVQGLLRDHVIEVFADFMRDPNTLGMLRQNSSGADTYGEIIRFFAKHKQRYHEHWAYLVKAGMVADSKPPEDEPCNSSQNRSTP